jgi:hypothetical protein
MQRTVPAWNRLRTPATFFATALLLGGLATVAVIWSHGDLAPEPIGGAIAPVLAWAGFTLAAYGQLTRRRRFFDRYERLGV